MVSKITNSNGDTVKNIEPRVLKQTISATTSEQMRQYLHNTVALGTGKSARPAGYAIGGKTGTAEMVPRDHTNYVVSFIGFAPADDPQIAIYCVVDRPNVAKQAHATYATGIVKNILTEVLPYLHIAKTEEMTIAEQEEVDKLLGNIVQGNPEPENENENEGGDSDAPGGEGQGQEGQGEADGDAPEEDKKPSYIVDPDTGELVDPVTGKKAEMDYSTDGGAVSDADELPDGASGNVEGGGDNNNGPPQQ